MLVENKIPSRVNVDSLVGSRVVADDLVSARGLALGQKIFQTSVTSEQLSVTKLSFWIVIPNSVIVML